MMRWLLLILCLPFAAGCQAIRGDDTAATLQSDLLVYETEVAQLRQDSQDYRTSSQATIEAAQTQSAAYLNYNRMVLATVQAGEIATPAQRAVVQGGGADASDLYDTSDGQMRFVQVGVSGYVRPDDGCFERHQNFFNIPNTPRIFLVGLALNMQAGTTLRAEWMFQNTIVHQSQWSAPNSGTRDCIAIEITPANAAFAVGDWSVALFADGRSVATVPFTMTDG